MSQENDGGSFDVFAVEICGSIQAASDTDCAAVRICVTDVTETVTKAQPVHGRFKEWQEEGSLEFVYLADLGRIPGAEATLSDWIAVAKIRPDWLVLPRRGKRNLHFSTSILSRESGEKFACAECDFTCKNTAFGYIDLEENIERAKRLGVTLAFAVSAADNKLYDCEVELIKKWARENIACQASDRAGRKLEKALRKTVGFFRDGNQVNSYEICKEIVEIAPVAERYEILELCLGVARANGRAAVEELAVLKELASRLEVDMNRFRAMMEKVLPVSMHEVEDAEVVLGVTSDMGREQTRQRLNEEYRKWNARVTSCEPEVQSQAEHMLKFIAEARSEYVA